MSRTGSGLAPIFAAGFVLFGIANTMSGPLIPSLRSDYQLSLSGAGSLFTMQFAGFVLSVLVGGAIADIFGKRAFVLLGTAVLTCGLALVGCFRGPWSLNVGFFMIGVGFGGFDAGLAPLVGDLNSDKRAFVLNLLHMFFGVGAFFGPAWASYLVSAAGPAGWRYAYLTAAGSSLLFLVAFGKCRVRPALQDGRDAGQKPFMSLVGDGRLRLLAGLACVYVGVESAVNAWVFSFLTNSLKATSAVASAATCIFWASLTLGRLFSAYACERFGQELFIVCCCAGSVLAGLPLAMGPGVSMTLASCAALGFFFSGIFPTIMAEGASLVPNSTGSVTGMLVAAGAVGGALVPWLIGLVSDARSLERGMALIPIASGLMLALALANKTGCRRRN